MERKLRERKREGKWKSPVCPFVHCIPVGRIRSLYHTSCTGDTAFEPEINIKGFNLLLRGLQYYHLYTHTHTYSRSHTPSSWQEKNEFCPKGLTRDRVSLWCRAHRGTSDKREKAHCSEPPVFNRSRWHLLESSWAPIMCPWLVFPNFLVSLHWECIQETDTIYSREC